MENYIPDYSYENCFWDNVDFLYNHSNLKYKEYSSLGNLSSNIANCIYKFCKSLNLAKNDYKPYEKNDISSRGKALIKTIRFINNIINNLKKFADKLIKLSKTIDEKKCSYDSKNDVKIMCRNAFNKYEDSLKELNIKKSAYYESINQTIEQYLNNIYKNKRKDSMNSLEMKIENINKKKKSYKEQIIKTETNRIEYIELQRNIFSSDEEFERDCTNEIKIYLKNIIFFYEEFLKKIDIDKELIDEIEKIDGMRDNQIFAAKNRTIMSCPSRIEFMEYNQDIDTYSNLEVVKNQLKNKKNGEYKSTRNKISDDVKKFLIKTLKNSKDENYLKIEEIANNIISNNLSEENYNYLMKQFQKSYDDFKIWVKENVGELEFKKVGENYDNRFLNMQLFLDAFNKARMHNKELNKNNFNFFAQAMEKILSYNDNEDIDYKLCELLLTLSSTFYTIEKKDDKEIKIYATEIVKKSPLIQKVGFWVGLTKFELSEEMLKDKDKDKDKEKSKENNSNKINEFFNNLNLAKFSLIKRRKSKEEKELKENKEIKDNKLDEKNMNKNFIAKIMSVCYNLVQFIMESDTLNAILINIFRNFKISKENREIVIGMMNCHIESEENKNLKINEEMIMNCDNIEYYINYNEYNIIKEKKENNNDNINENINIEEENKNKNKNFDDKKDSNNNKNNKNIKFDEKDNNPYSINNYDNIDNGLYINQELK